MVGIPARQTLIDAQEYQRHFVPYSTPCTDAFDPATRQLEIIQCELEQLRKRIAELMEERSAQTNDLPAKGKVGRAAGRERGCQDEEISGVAVSYTGNQAAKNY